MGPSNDHELAIARIVDKMSIESRLYATAIPEVAGAVKFAMSISDSEFLARYLQWRMAHPIPK